MSACDVIIRLPSRGLDPFHPWNAPVTETREGSTVAGFDSPAAGVDQYVEGEISQFDENNWLARDRQIVVAGP